MTERQTSRTPEAERARRRRNWLAATEPARAAMSIASLLAGAPFLAFAPRVRPLMHPGADDRSIASSLGISRGDVEAIFRHLQHDRL